MRKIDEKRIKLDVYLTHAIERLQELKEELSTDSEEVVDFVADMSVINAHVLLKDIVDDELFKDTKELLRKLEQEVPK